MGLEIRLAPEEQRLLERAARAQGTTPELLAADFVRECLPSTDAAVEASGPRSVADWLGDSIGVLDSGEIVPGGARLSERISERFAADLQRKRENGHL